MCSVPQTFIEHQLVTKQSLDSKDTNVNNRYLVLHVHSLARKHTNQEFYHKVKYNGRCAQGVLSPVGLPGVGDAWPDECELAKEEKTGTWRC